MGKLSISMVPVLRFGWLSEYKNNLLVVRLIKSDKCSEFSTKNSSFFILEGATGEKQIMFTSIANMSELS